MSHDDYDDGRGGTRMLGFALIYCAVVVLVLGGLLLSCGCSYAVIGSAAGDVVSTRVAQARNPNAYEANPLLGQSFAQQVIVKAAGTGGVIWGAHVLTERGHKTVAKVLQAAVIVMNVAIAAQNFQKGRIK